MYISHENQIPLLHRPIQEVILIKLHIFGDILTDTSDNDVASTSEVRTAVIIVLLMALN
jgi:hypothetical protein